MPATDNLAARYSSEGASGDKARVREAAMLFAIAESCMDEDGDYQRALQAATAALAIFQEVGDEHAEADALRLLLHAQRFKAESIRNSGDEIALVKAERAAMSYAQRMIETFRKSGNKRSLGAMLLSAAEICFEKTSGTHESRRSDQEKALEYTKEAQVLLREAKDKFLEATSMLMLCVLYLRPNPGVARKAGNAALALFKSESNPRGQAKSLQLLAHACFRDGSVEEGIHNGQQAVSLLKDLDEDAAAALMLYSLAQRQLTSRKPGEATVPAEEASSIFQEIEDDKGWQTAAEALIVEAEIMGGVSELALTHAEAGVARVAGAEVAKDRILALDTAARAQVAVGDKDKALAHAEAALQLCRDMGGDRSWEAAALHLIAQVQCSREEHGKAAVMASGAWRLYKRAGDDEGEAAAMLTEAQADLDSGEFWDASETADDALLLARELGDKSLEAAALVAAASAHLARQEGAEALAAAREALNLFQASSGGQAGEAKVLQLIAEVHILHGDPNLAVDPARKALAILRQLGDAKAEVGLLKVLASLHFSRNKHDEAVRAAQDAFALEKRLGMSTKQEAEATLLLCQTMFSRVCHDAQASKDPWPIVSRGEPKVMKPAEDALELARKEGDKPLLAFALYTFASVTKYLYISLGKLEKLGPSMQASTEATALFKEFGDKSGEGNATLLSAELNLALNKMQQAQDLANKATSLATSCGDNDLKTRAMQLFHREAPRQRRPVQQMELAEMPAAAPEQPVSLPEETSDSMAAAAQPKGLDRGYVQRLVQTVALEAIGDSDQVDMDQALMESGLDSLAAITFRNKLQQETGMKLAGTLMFDHPTMAAVTDHIVEISMA